VAVSPAATATVSHWSIVGVSARIRAAVQVNDGTRSNRFEAAPGFKSIQVNAEMRWQKAPSASLPIAQIVLDSTGSDGSTQHASLAFAGLCDPNGECVPQSVQGIVSGNGASTSPDASRRMVLSRVSPGAPLLWTLTGASAQVCLVFVVPRATTGTLTLHFGDALALMQLAETERLPPDNSQLDDAPGAPGEVAPVPLIAPEPPPVAASPDVQSPQRTG